MFDDKNKTESLYHVALAHLKRVTPGSNKGNDSLRSLLEEYGSLENVFTKESPERSLEVLLKTEANLQKAKRKLEKISFIFEAITINDSRFPEHLKQVKGVTPILYVSGDATLLDKKSIAIVGTRELTFDKDKTDGEKIVQDVLNKEYVVVSGLAQGCDELAHRYTINHQGRTVGVLGTPLDKYYPRENQGLQDQIRERHLLVSQYPIGIKTFPWHFAARNKTMVGLAKRGVVVILAGDKSGTQHAIKECLAQGKELYVLRNNLSRGYEWVEKLRGRYKVLNPEKES